MPGFEMLKQSEVSKQELDHIRKTGASTSAKMGAYLVAIAAIVMLSMIFAQTTSAVFTDPTMKIVGALAAMVVGASSIVFLIFKNALLKSHQQFTVACVFVGIEFSALTLGAFHTFGTALGWTFDPFITELTKVAIVLTLPIVAIEWIVVLALDPDARTQRAESASKSELSTVERQTRERFRMSDPVIAIRNAAALTEVIHEELIRLPTDQRAMFVGILRGKHGNEFEGVPLLLPGESALPNVIDQPKAKPQPAAAHPEPSRMEQIKDTLHDAFFGQPDNAPVTMASEGQAAAETTPTARVTGGGTIREDHGPKEPRPEVSTEEWRLRNASENLTRAEYAHHGTPPNMRDGESLFRPYDPMANWNDTRLENDLKAAQANYDQAKAAYNAAQQAAPKSEAR